LNLGRNPCVCSATESLSGTVQEDASSRFYAGRKITTWTPRSKGDAEDAERLRGYEAIGMRINLMPRTS